MIGGQDIHFEVPSGAEALDFAVRAVLRRWPKAVFVSGDGPHVITRYDELGFGERGEIIVYRDQAACSEWRRIGYHESLKGTMIYLISEPMNLTLVVEDDPVSPEVQVLLRTIRTGLYHLSSYMPKVAA